MTRCISLLGSTGSIGRQTLDIARSLGIPVAALTANGSVDLMETQCREFLPELAVMFSEDAALELKKRLAGLPIRVETGMDGLVEAATLSGADTVVTAVMGMVGLRPTLAAIEKKKRIALANKETLVCAGELVMARAAACGAEIIPVDSEHSAIFQCLAGYDRAQVRKLILTASGGPFFGKTREELQAVTCRQALKHPNWAMGAKITIDSASLMNKGLELIEAMRLYGLPMEQVDIVVHRQSIIHSLVEFCDGAMLAQLGTADMRIPIQLALTWPDREACIAEPLDLLKCGDLTFAAPDENAFPCLALAKQAVKAGGTACAVLNGANEVAVSLFLQEKIGFYGISDLISRALDTVDSVMEPTLEAVLQADSAAREVVLEQFGG